VVSIAERMTNIEMRLDDLDAKLDQIRNLIASNVPASAKEPPKAPRPSTKPRVRKPAKKGKK